MSVMVRRLLVLALACMGVAIALWLSRQDARRPSTAPMAADTLIAEPGLGRSSPLVQPVEEAARSAAARAEVDGQAQPPVRLELVEWHGAPAGEVEVALLPEGGGMVSGTTDHRGWIAFDPEVDGGVLYVRREAAPVWRSPEPFGRGEHRIELPAGEEVSGRLLVNGLAPAEPLELKLGVAGSAAAPAGLSPAEVSTWGRLMRLATVTTAARRGEFHFRGFAAGAKVLLHMPFGWRLRYGRRMHEVTAPARGLELELVRALHGRALDAATREPVSGAIVGFTVPEPRGIALDLTTDALGRFCADTEQISLHAGLRVSVTDEAGGRVGSVEFPPGQVPEDRNLGDILLRQVGGLRFRALTRAGEPLSGVVGKPETKRSHLLDTKGTPPTDAEGWSRFSVLPPDATGLRFIAAGHRLARIPMPAPEIHEIEVLLDPCARLEVHVHGPPEWIEACSLQLRGLEKMVASSGTSDMMERHVRRGPWVGGWSTGIVGGEHLVTISLPPGGLLVLDDLEPVGFTLGVLNAARDVLHEQWMAPLGTLEVRVVRIDLPATLGWIRGRIVDASGAAVGQANVQGLLANGSPKGGWSSQADGRFAVGPFLEERVDLGFSTKDAGGLVMRGVSTRSGEDLLVRLEPRTRLEVHVRDVSGAPVDGGHLVVQDLRGTRLGVRTRGPGKYEVECDPHEGLHATLRLAGRRYERDHDPAHGRLEIELPLLGSVDVSWTGSLDEPAMLVLVDGISGEPIASFAARPGADGTSIPHVLPGTYRLFLRTFDAAKQPRDSPPAELTVAGGRSTAVTLRVE